MMLPTDSINSYHSAMPGLNLGTDGEFLPLENDKLPVDVIEALQKDDLELALKLLKEHRNEGVKEGPSGAIINLMKKFMRAVRFNFHVAKPAKKKGKKGAKKVSQTSHTVQAPKGKAVKNMVKAVVRTLTKVGKLPVRIAVSVVDLGKTIVVKTMKAVHTAVVKPVIAPFIKITEYLFEKYRSVETFVSEKFALAAEKIKEIREVIKEKVDKVVEEIKELAKPVEKWLKLKFEKFTENQHWVKETFGKQYQNFVKISEITINMIALVAIPFTFSAKQLNGSLNFLRKKFAEQKNRFKSFSQKISGFIGGKIKAFADAVRPFKDALLRILQMIVNVIQTFIIWIIQLIRKIVQVLLKLAVWMKDILVRLYRNWIRY